MRLMSAVLGFVLRRMGLLGALVLSLFLGYLLIQALIPALREAVAERDRLQQVAEERAALEQDLEQLRSTAAENQSKTIESLEGKIDAEIEEGRRNVTEKKAEIERLRDDQQEICGFVRDLIDLVTPGNACKTAEIAVEKADEALDTLERSLARLRRTPLSLATPT
jgi:cell division protein FtsB